MSRSLPLSVIHPDEGIQPRAVIDPATGAEYAHNMQAGATFPPVVVFYDGAVYWLADGFHRYRAAQQAGQAQIAVIMRPGSQRDAVLYAVGANVQQGLRRRPADKRRSVETLLRDSEWAQWTDQEIARQAEVSTDIVRVARKRLADQGLADERPEPGRHEAGEATQ